MNARFIRLALVASVVGSGSWAAAQTTANPQTSGPNNVRRMDPPPAYAPAKPEPIDPALRSKARGIIETLATGPEVIARANAIEAAQRTLGADARSIIIRGFSDSAPVVRFAACVAAGDLKLSDTRPVLLKLAYDTDPNVCLAARYGLHKVGDSTLSQQLVQFGLHDERRGVRANAVMLMGMLGEKSAIAPLRRLVGDEAPVVRLQVSEALWRLGDEKALDDLVARTVSKFADEQVVAVIALAQARQAEVLPHITGMLVADFPEVSLAAARAAGMLNADAGYGVAAKYVKSDEPRQRSMAAQAFGDIGRSDAQSRLRPLLDDVNQDVRLAAATAVLKLNEGK